MLLQNRHIAIALFCLCTAAVSELFAQLPPHQEVPVAVPAVSATQGAEGMVTDSDSAGTTTLADETMPRSLLLSQQDHRRIKNALEDYKNSLLPQRKGQDGQVIASPKVEPERSRYFTYPQFFLESLVYHSREDWYVRVNGRKITPQTLADQGSLTIVALDHDKAMFRWKPVEMARVLEAWDKLPLPPQDKKTGADNASIKMEFNESDKILDKVPDAPVIVDKERRLVTFVLHPNQTFSSFSMMVLEGKVKPVTVDNLGDAGAETKPVTGDSLPAADLVIPGSPVHTEPVTPGAPVDDKNSRLEGLMRRMEQNKEVKP